ncbi:hypothetical protein SAMN02800692_1501 [Luteibacter sp. UNC138MFCol5.1]|uniref:hypothetical protein n=1 Tax=Luteibacter sp. UNC138MFCol5.1 TaxID=1502774 RepID=UPI0008AAE0C6|nr:hypothetical protein [Luteibacter sp. UNC138MFCol5.1]SEO63143.1 hypothetical protein SAMN02800692_1501 [Luteibacter sp. UNC138MFCol5.1]
MAISRIDFRPTAQGGDNGTAALMKLDQNCADLDLRLSPVEAIVVAQGGRSLLLNGDLRVNQAAFAGGAMGANTYGYDMWRTVGAGATFALSSDRTTITLTGTIAQVLETPDIANATVTVSVWNPSAPITVKLQPDGSTATTATGTIPAGAGKQSVTLVVPSSLTSNVFMLLSTAGATSFDGPAKRRGVQLELGSFATNFERRHIAVELAAAQRYYEAGRQNADFYMIANQTATFTASFKVQKRAVAAINAAYSYTANSFNGIADNITVNGFRYGAAATASGLTAFALNWTADARL